MFATESFIQARRGEYGTTRFVHLQKLVTEYQDTSDIKAKKQIIANLANFAYDPYNYIIMKELNIIDLFLDGLTEGDSDIVEYAMGGICNSMCDSEFASIVLSDKSNMKSIIKLLSSSDENTVISVMTTLVYLCEYEEGKKLVLKPNVINALKTFADCNNKKLSNIASLLINMICLTPV